MFRRTTVNLPFATLRRKLIGDKQGRLFFSTLPDHLKSADIFNPTEEHASLRKMVREFAEKEIDPQALEFNRLEKFNVDLFRKFGQLGLLGITVEQEYGGSEMDATAAVIANGKKICLIFSYQLKFIFLSQIQRK
jgi:alkylation response protein AidB-like acyl-CoA dehydrogenase